MWSVYLLSISLIVSASAQGQPVDPASRFGARPQVEFISLSPDGSQIAMLMPIAGQGAAGIAMAPVRGAKPSLFVTANGKPERLSSCKWVSGVRLVCRVHGIAKSGLDAELLPYSRLVAVDQDGGNLRLLSTRSSISSIGYNLNGGRIVDWLPDEPVKC